jgi:hypothetical protein
VAIYLTEMANWLRNAGLTVVEYQGWESRARGSGGYSDYPLCVMWHHTASPPSWDGQKDADYCAVGDSDAPLSNLYIDRSGTVWVLAAGATNTNGKGKSINFSRGTVPADGMNSRAVGVEMGNDGIGERWPIAQVNSAFVVSNTMNSHLGNQPDDISTHQFYAPDRKIDPATTNVEGPWQPVSCTSSGTWDRGSVQQECLARAGQPAPGPGPQPPQPPTLKDGEMALLTRFTPDNSIWIVAEDFSWKFMVCQETHDSLKATGRYSVVYVDPSELQLVPGVQ